MTWSNYLHDIWYDLKHPASYSGPDKLYRIVKKEGKFKIGRTRIKQWLQNQDAYGLSRNIVRKFPRNRYVSKYSRLSVGNRLSRSLQHQVLQRQFQISPLRDRRIFPFFMDSTPHGQVDQNRNIGIDGRLIVQQET